MTLRHFLHFYQYLKLALRVSWARHTRKGAKSYGITLVY